jgi:hypothetical protein
VKKYNEIWLLSRQFDFDGVSLAEAIRMTFEQRGTVLPIEIKAFDKTFISSKQIQWSAFRKRLQQDHVPASFQDIISAVETFLAPLASAIHKAVRCPGNGAPLDRGYEFAKSKRQETKKHFADRV